MTDPDLESNSETGTPLLDVGEGDLLALPFWSAPVKVAALANGEYVLRGTSGGRYRLRPTPQGYELTRADPETGGQGAEQLPAHVAADEIEIITPGSPLVADEVPAHRKVYVGRNLEGKRVEIRTPDGDVVSDDAHVTKAGQVVCPESVEGEPVEIWFADQPDE